MIIEYTCTSCPGGSALDGERAGAAADVEQSRRGVEIDRVPERACGEARQRVHRLPEGLEHRRVLALEHGALAVRVPCGRSVGADRLRKLRPPRVEPPVEHRHQAAEVVGGAAHEKPLAERRVAVAVLAAFEQAERRAAGQQHLRRPLLDAELARELVRGRFGAAGQAREEVELVGGRERLERPEAGRDLHQRHRGQRLGVLGCMSGRVWVADFHAPLRRAATRVHSIASCTGSAMWTRFAAAPAGPGSAET
jgi:hypothetical protein